MEAVARYVAIPHPRRGAERDLSDRLKPAPADCARPPSRRIIVNPDFQALSHRPGALTYVALNFGVTEDGLPRDVRIVASVGDEELDREALDALSQWRFTRDRPASGCMYTFWKGPEPIPAPPGPAGTDALDDACPLGEEWAYLPALERYFPAAFLRRKIEGWATMRFDVASWGQTGRVEVIEAQPAMVFGDTARRVVQAARKPESAAGGIGCVTTVRFRDQAEEEEPDRS